MNKQNSDYGLEQFTSLIESSDEPQRKELESVMKRINYFNLISRALIKNTNIKTMIFFAQKRSWMEFNMVELERWLVEKSDLPIKDPNKFAHSILDAAIRGVANPITIVSTKNVDDMVSAKKTYYFDQNFKKYVQEFFNLIIPIKES